jgi:hypothetical protein
MLELPLAARRRIVIISRFVGLVAISAACSTSFAHPGSCGAAQYRQFDFWIGDWDAFDPDGANSAHVQVTPILDGCVLQEIYEGANGANGRSSNAGTERHSA